MPNYKIVDADELDSGLQIVADSIKAKSGISGKLEFPYGLKEAADSITASNVIDNVEIALDFSNGDMTESLPEGYSVSSATILKPDTLIAENIAEGVTIAGIVGTHECECNHNILETVEITPNFANGDFTESLPDGYYAHAAKVLKPGNLIPENIAEGITIAGIVGTHKGGGGAATDEPYVSYGYDDSGNVISASFHKCTTVPQYAFYNNTTLQSVDFSGSPNLTSIGTYAFNGCTNLTSISIPNTVTSIGTYAFKGCTKLTSISIPNGVTSIENYTFNGCTNLTSISIPNGVTSIGTYAFNGCTNLTSISIPNSVTSIGNNAFYQCSGLKHITLLANITSIPQAAFSKCVKLESITLPNTVTSIGAQAFYGCQELTSITIPASVTSIAKEAFWNCYKLVEVINESSLTFALGATSNGYVAYYAMEVHSGASKIVNVNDYLFYTYSGNNYLLSYVGVDKELTLPDYNGENYEIYSYAFYTKSIALTGVTLPNTVTSIGDYAFQSTGIANITIPASVISIGVEAFKYTNKLTSVTFADTSGWYVTKTKGATSGTNLTSANLSNTSTAEDYLTSTYVMYYWYNT